MFDDDDQKIALPENINSMFCKDVERATTTSPGGGCKRDKEEELV